MPENAVSASLENGAYHPRLNGNTPPEQVHKGDGRLVRKTLNLTNTVGMPVTQVVPLEKWG